MKTQDIQTLAAEAAKNIRTEQDLNEFKQLLTKMTLEYVTDPICRAFCLFL